MNLYTYVANSNPSMAKALCHKYGYKITGVQTKDDLGVVLEQLVSKEGEPALKDIVLNHPDRELILEYGDNEKKLNMVGFQNHDGHCSCGCGGACEKKKNYVNYIGEENNQTTNSLVAQTNTFLLASAFLLGVAIISKKL